jgi:DNA-directed RNA polymerase subunit L
MKKLVLTFASLCLVVSIYSCRETKEEKIEVQVEESMDDAADAVEEAVEDTGDAMENAAQEVEDEVEGNDDAN